MDPVLFALVERVHGHLAVLGLAVLLHPVITLRTRRGLTGRTQLTADLGAALLLVPFALGWWIYPAYRAGPKLELLAFHPGAAAAFESKEHLAAVATACAVAGALALRAARGHAGVRRVAWTLLLAAWLTGALTAALGIWAAAHGAG